MEKLHCPKSCLRGLISCDHGYSCERNNKLTEPITENTLQKLRLLNPERCKAFGHTVEQMSVLFWSTAVAGETGELCNWIKKYKRGDHIPDILDKIGNEAADIVIYLDLLCTKFGISLEEFIISKFNKVSDELKSDIKL